MALIGVPDGLFLVLNCHDRDDRPKGLFFHHLHVMVYAAQDSGLIKARAQVFCTSSSDLDNRASLDSFCDVLFDDSDLSGVDH
jgi:hypothetical protein